MYMYRSLLYMEQSRDDRYPCILMRLLVAACVSAGTNIPICLYISISKVVAILYILEGDNIHACRI